MKRTDIAKSQGGGGGKFLKKKKFWAIIKFLKFWI